MIVSTDGGSFAGPVADTVYLLAVFDNRFVLRRTAVENQAIFAPQEAVDQLVGSLATIGTFEIESGPYCSVDAPTISVTFFDPVRPSSRETATNSFSFDPNCFNDPSRAEALSGLAEVSKAICEFTTTVFGKEDYCPPRP